MSLEIPGYTVSGIISQSCDEVFVHGRRKHDGVAVVVRTNAANRWDTTLAARARRADELSRQLGRSSVARVMQIIDAPGRTALVYPAGALVAEHVAPRGVTIEQFFAIALAITAALETIHQTGWIHGDVRPTTIQFDRATGRATFLDLQWATRRDATDAAPALSDGMLPYVAPERTGRPGAPGDQRADIYAVGATLYELLCGHPPFLADDLSKLVHAHAAVVAPSVCDLRPEVPAVIGEIVRKALAKSPEHRYQTCRGLLADLERARGSERNASFELGHADAPPHLDLPRKLYGRDAERAELVDCFARVTTGDPALLVVVGPPGVGKSALIADLEPHVANGNGFFISGKFDQLLLNAPYSAIKKSFGELVQRLLAESEQHVEHWRIRVLDAVAGQGRLLVDLIPSVEDLIGPQPPVEVVGPVEAQHRLVTVFRRFVRELATVDHPLVLFLDDWHWADAASVSLVEELLAGPEPGALLLVLAYRERELASTGRAHAALERMRQLGVSTTQLALQPLGSRDIASLIAETLGCASEHAARLASVIAARTKGNPLFVRSFLQSLFDTGRLTHTPGGGWACDVEAVEREGDASVSDLLVARIGRLPRRTRDVLELASCLGNEFRTRDLAIAAHIPEGEIEAFLVPAVEAALITPAFSSYRFVHDRVQEAVYTSIDADARARKHISIGRRLRAASGGEPTTQTVEQLNAGRALIQDAAERLELAELNLRASQQARGATEYAAAAQHATVGIELAGEACWEQAYDLALSLFALRAESEYLSGRFALAEELYEVALRHARSDVDRIRILRIKKDQFELQGRYIEAIQVLREGLALVGVVLPDSDDALDALLQEELAELPRNLRGRRIDQLIDEPEITDPHLIATLQLLMGLWPSCYVAGLQRLLKVVSFKIANFCLRHGNSDVASAGYANYSFIAGFVTGDYESAYEFGKLGIALSERYPNRAVRSWCYFLFGCGTAVWRRPLAECTPYLERAFELGVESGSVASACYAATYIVTDSFFQGKPLAEVAAIAGRFDQYLAANTPAIHMYLELGALSIWRLRGRDDFEDAGFLAAFGHNPFFMATYAFGQLAAAYHLDTVEHAVECANRASQLVPELLSGIFKVPETALYSALAWLAAAERASGSERQRLRTAAAEQLTQLRQLASQCEENILHKALLVEAELARIDGNFDTAIALFDRAADTATRAGFQQYAALACELASRAWRARGVPRAARAYLRDAYEGYRTWDATAKVRALEARHPELLSAAASGPVRDDVSAPFDVLAIARAAQAISREIERDALLRRLMNVLVEHAGARRGALVLVDRDRIEVVAAAEGFDVAIGSASSPLDPAKYIVESIVRYVVRTGEPVRLGNAAREGRFTRDPQVRQRGSSSIICVPLGLQERVTGAIFLENELGAAAFTRTREVILELLAGQAAISLENSRLYADLKAANRELAEARTNAELLNRMKDEFLAILGHELRNPLAPVLTACQLMEMVDKDTFAREREVIHRQVAHMMRLVDDMLDVSRIARGKIALTRKRVDLRDVVKSALEIVTPLLEQRSSRIALSSSDEPLVVDVDPIRIAQVVSNVVANAIKFSPRDSVIEVAIERTPPDAVVSVVDHGAGIPAELLPAIFDMFVQAHQARDRRLGGLGLGLSIAKNLVDLHGGTIEAHSEGTGKGARFRIAFPLAPQLSATSDITHAAPAIARTGHPRHILVVDDNVDAAQLLVDAISAIGHKTSLAHDGPTALRQLGELHPDIVLLDIGLPVMDGFEVARRIRAELGAASPRLVAVTGYHTEAGPGRKLFDEYIVKPASMETLSKLLESLAPHDVRSANAPR